MLIILDEELKMNILVIVGGVVGVVGGVLLIVSIVFCILWKCKKDYVKFMGCFNFQFVEGIQLFLSYWLCLFFVNLWILMDLELYLYFVF